MHVKKYCRIIFYVFLLFSLTLNSAPVPDSEYEAEENTLFLCHFNAIEEIKELNGEISERVSLVPGKFGKGILVEKSGDFVAFPAEGNINLSEGTVEMWVKPIIDLKEIKHPDDGHAVLFHMWGDKDNIFNIYYNSHNRTIVASVNRIEEGTVFPSPQARADWKSGEWRHLAVTWGNGVFIYFDGELVASSRLQGNIKVLPEKFYLGATTWRAWPARMVIDEVRILNKQISFYRP